MHSSSTRPARSQARVLLLAARAGSLTAGLPWAGTPLEVRVSAGCPEEVARGGLPYPARRLRPAAVTGQEALRAAASSAKSRYTARRAGVPADWLWTVKRDRWLRKALRGTDVVVSMDRDTDGVLALVPELVADTTVVRYAEHARLGAGLDALNELLTLLHGHVDRVEGQADRQPLEEGERAALEALVDRVVAEGVPGELLPVDELARLGRWLPTRLGVRHGADVVLNVLGRLPWGDSPSSGTGGVDAQQAIARLWLAEEESDLPGDAELAAVAGAALAGADQALAAGDAAVALGRLVDAMGVVFHRERHAESTSSPMVREPQELLGPLWASRTFRELVAGGSGPRVRPRRSSESDAPRLLVLTGAYGRFHGPVVTALSEVAPVRVRDLASLCPLLAPRLLDPSVIESLARLRGWGAGQGLPEDPEVDAQNRQVLGVVAPLLRRADVVFSDWADRATVWASHLRPEGVRLVVRIHSLDALDPWFHLVSWADVDEVLVVSEPLRLLVERLLRVAGAEVPVTVVPNLAAVREVDRPKEPAARTTLGMIGWGRRVKDPLWALDLLARDPSWRLVLIGPDLASGLSGVARSYNAQVRARLLDPKIGDRVEFVGWTDDIARHLQRVGVILSTSRRESWHLGLVEGAASGAVPVVRDWPLLAPLGGVRSLYPAEWVVADLDEAEARVRAVTAPDAWEVARRRAQEQALDLFDPETVARRYREVILGPLLPDGSGPAPAAPPSGG